MKFRIRFIDELSARLSDAVHNFVYLNGKRPNVCVLHPKTYHDFQVFLRNTFASGGWFGYANASPFNYDFDGLSAHTITYHGMKFLRSSDIESNLIWLQYFEEEANRKNMSRENENVTAKWMEPAASAKKVKSNSLESYATNGKTKGGHRVENFRSINDDFISLKFEFTGVVYDPKYGPCVVMWNENGNCGNRHRKDLDIRLVEFSDRKIIGYKVKEGVDRMVVGKMFDFNIDDDGCDTESNELFDFKVDSKLHGLATKAGVLDAVFEPVYEDLFKPGTAVMVINGGMGANGANNKFGVVASHDAKITGGCWSTDEIGIKVKIEGDVWGLRKGEYEIRLATAKEIEESKIKRIKLRSGNVDFEIEVSEKGIYYRSENVWFHPSDLKKFLENIDKVNKEHSNRAVGFRLSSGCGEIAGDAPYTLNLSTVTIGCKKDLSIESLRELMKVYDDSFLKNNL